MPNGTSLIDQSKFPKLELDHTWRMILRLGKLVMQSLQPPKQNNQKAGGPPVITSATPCTPPRGIGLQLIYDAMA